MHVAIGFKSPNRTYSSLFLLPMKQEKTRPFLFPTSQIAVALKLTINTTSGGINTCTCVTESCNHAATIFLLLLLTLLPFGKPYLF